MKTREKEDKKEGTEAIETGRIAEEETGGGGEGGFARKWRFPLDVATVGDEENPITWRTLKINSIPPVI